MSLLRLATTAGGIGGPTTGTDAGWFLYTDSGSTTEDSIDVSNNLANGLVVNDSHIFMALHSEADFGRTNECFLLVDVDMDGALNYEKILQYTSDAQDLARNGYTDSQYADNPNDTDGVIMALKINAIAGMAHLSSAGAVSAAATSGITDDISDGAIGVLSNGDTWHHNGDSSELVLLDASAGTPYATSLVEMSLDGANDGATRNFYSMKVDSSDNLFVLSEDAATTQKCAIFKINSAGTISESVLFYEYADTSDTVTPLSMSIDSSNNVYVMWQNFDNSESSTYTYLSKFNSSLVLQWTAIFDKDPPNGQELTSSIAFSPDGSRVYVSFPANPGADNGEIGIFDATDGTILSYFYIRGTGAHVLSKAQVATNSDSVVIGCVYGDGSYHVGHGILKLTQTAFEAGGTYGICEIYDHPSPPVTSVGLTHTETAVETTSSATLTEADESSNLETIALDVALTHTLTDITI